jgi:hypothetical protein
LFNVKLELPELARPLTTVHKPRKAPVVLNQDEMIPLLEAAPGLKYKAAFGVAYGEGLRHPWIRSGTSKRMTLRSARIELTAFLGRSPDTAS